MSRDREKFDGINCKKKKKLRFAEKCAFSDDGTSDRHRRAFSRASRLGVFVSKAIGVETALKIFLHARVFRFKPLSFVLFRIHRSNRYCRVVRFCFLRPYNNNNKKKITSIARSSGFSIGTCYAPRARVNHNETSKCIGVSIARRRSL